MLQPDLKKYNVYSPYPSNCLISIPTFNSLVSNVTSSHLQQDLISDLLPTSIQNSFKDEIFLTINEMKFFLDCC